MEAVLDVYKRSYDPLRPVLGMDETPIQLIGETRQPLPTAPGKPLRIDYEYSRLGVCALFWAVEPLTGKRIARVKKRRTKKDWAMFMEEIASHYSHAEKITIVMDNLNQY